MNELQQPPVSPAASGKAKTALGLGIGSVAGACLCPLIGLGLAIPALILGIMALSSGNVADKTLATWGTVLGGLGIILAVLNMIAGFAMFMNESGY